jgi:hypothetical protein
MIYMSKIPIDNLIIELLATAVFVYSVLSTKSALVVGIITASNIYLSNGIAMFNPLLAMCKLAAQEISVTNFGMVLGAQLIGTLIGYQLYQLMFNRRIGRIV